MKSQSITTLFLFSLLLLSACKEEDPAVSFSINKSVAEIRETISFNNLSENSTDYIWDFGDGNASAELNPTHTYEEVGTYTVTLTAYNGIGTKGTSTQTIEIVPPPLNIEPGIRAGNFYLTDDLRTHFTKLDTNQMNYSYILTTNGEYLHTFTFDYVGIRFLLYTPTDDYKIDNVPNQIEVYPPFDAWAMGGITFGSSFEEVVEVFGPHPTSTGPHIYDGIIFWDDNSGLLVRSITVR